MKKKFIASILTGTLTIGMLSGCGNFPQETAETVAQSEETPMETPVQETEEEADTSYYEDGRAYLYGLDGKEIELEEAYANFEKAVEEGETEAYFYLGVLCYNFKYPNKDDQKAKYYFEAAGDNPYAQILLGELYYLGRGVEEDKVKGQDLIDTVIEQGCTEGYLLKGYIAEDEEDYDTAMEYYNKALESDEQLFIASARCHIGNVYYNGRGVEQDYAKALEWYEKAADLGNSSAMNQIGNLYGHGLGVELDYAQALEWLEKSADLGNSDAMNNIAYMYYDGLGVEQDYTQALEWFEKSADLGVSDAMTNIAYIYQNGQGVEQDYTKALEWYEKAADLENSVAMYFIGYMYYFGDGVEQDYIKALEWFRKSADLGDTYAIDTINDMYEKGLVVEESATETSKESESVVQPEATATTALATEAAPQTSTETGSIKERGDAAIATKGYIDVGIDMTWEEYCEYMGIEIIHVENDGRGKDLSGTVSSVVIEENAG